VFATIRGHLECARDLLEAGADTEQPTATGSTSLAFAYSLKMTQLLCSYGAKRAPLFNTIRFLRRTRECRAWLQDTVRWVSPLHHFELMAPARVRELLRAGADVHASDGGEDAPTPLSLAQALHQHECAQLVIAAAEPWSRRTHELFPLEARKCAAELLVIGQLLAKQPMFTGHAMALLDVWTLVIAYTVTR
jgi:hypothetical protein